MTTGWAAPNPPIDTTEAEPEPVLFTKSVFKKGEFTPTLNWIFDKAMPKLSVSGFKILMCVVRQTWGWEKEDGEQKRKQWDRISWSQFQKSTGLSRDGCRRGLRNCFREGYIMRRKIGAQEFEYSVSRPTAPVLKTD
jgi:hypothetical protein